MSDGKGVKGVKWGPINLARFFCTTHSDECGKFRICVMFASNSSTDERELGISHSVSKLSRHRAAGVFAVAEFLQDPLLQILILHLL